jgi:hypothetical protein
VLEHQQTQHDLGWDATPATQAALRMLLGEGLVDHRHDLRVIERAISLAHPGFVQVGHLCGNQPVAKTTLRPPRLNHAPSSHVSARRHPDATAHD